MTFKRFSKKKIHFFCELTNTEKKKTKLMDILLGIRQELGRISNFGSYTNQIRGKRRD